MRVPEKYILDQADQILSQEPGNIDFLGQLMFMVDRGESLGFDRQEMSEIRHAKNFIAETLQGEMHGWLKKVGKKISRGVKKHIFKPVQSAIDKTRAELKRFEKRVKAEYKRVIKKTRKLRQFIVKIWVIAAQVLGPIPVIGDILQITAALGTEMLAKGERARAKRAMMAKYDLVDKALTVEENAFIVEEAKLEEEKKKTAAAIAKIKKEEEEAVAKHEAELTRILATRDEEIAKVKATVAEGFKTTITPEEVGLFKELLPILPAAKAANAASLLTRSATRQAEGSSATAGVSTELLVGGGVALAALMGAVLLI
jgi:hypothetical protein